MSNKFWDLFESFMAETQGIERAKAFRAKAEQVGVAGCDWKTESFKRTAAALGIKHQRKTLMAAESRHRPPRP